MYMTIIGSILVIASCTLVGLYFAYKDIFRIKNLLEVKRALNILKVEIEFAKSPLPEALSQIAARLDEEIGNIFKEIAESLGKREHESIQVIWSEAFEKSETYLTSDDMEQITALGKTLGYLDKNMQIVGIDMVVQAINEKISILHESSTKNKKMYQSLGVLSGLLVCVLLI